MSAERTPSKYDTHLDRTPANYQPLTPLSLLERTADVHPDRVAVIHAGHLTPARPRAEVTVSGLGLLMAGAGDPDAGSPHPTTPEAAHAS